MWAIKRTARRLRLVNLQLGRVGPPVLKKSSLEKAIRYTLDHWKTLVRSLGDGRYQIGTNLVERVMRPTLHREKELSLHWAPGSRVAQ